MSPRSPSGGRGGRPTDGAGVVRARFDEAQRIDMESFRDYDRETWRDVHVEDAVTIFASGTVIQGRDAIVDARAATSTTARRLVLDRDVPPGHGVQDGVHLYETTYEIPSIGFVLRARTGVTYTYEPAGGSWSPTRAPAPVACIEMTPGPLGMTPAGSWPLWA